VIRHWAVPAACVLSLSLGSVALAQTSVSTKTEIKAAVLSGVVQEISGNTVTVRELDGLRTFALPDGFKLRMGSKEIGIDELKPGMPVTADIVDQVTTREVTATKQVDGRVMQVAPGGFVLLDPNNQYVSYDFKDPQGGDYHYLASDGREDTLRDVKLGEHLQGTIVTHYPPQMIDERIVQLDVPTAPGLAAIRAAPLAMPRPSATVAPASGAATGASR
jgi:hypothetical protein